MITVRMLGYRSAPPSDPEDGDAYRDVQTGQSYMWLGLWFPLASNNGQFARHHMIEEEP